MAGSTWTGAGLLAAIVTYLAAVSVWGQLAPRQLQEVLGTPVEDVYSHWLLVVPCLLLCLSIAVATATRVPLDLVHAGAWCSHLGLIVLAGGALWYAARKVSGVCVTVRTRHGWMEIKQVYLSRRAAVYLAADRTGAGGMQARVPIVIGRFLGTQELDAEVRGGPEGVEIRAKRFLMSARLVSQWRNDSPNETPAIQLLIADGPHRFPVTLCPAYEAGARLRDLRLIYLPDLTDAELEALRRQAGLGGGHAPRRPVLRLFASEAEGENALAG